MVLAPDCLNKLNEFKFCEVSRIEISTWTWKFQLSILKNKKVIFLKKNIFYAVPPWYIQKMPSQFSRRFWFLVAARKRNRRIIISRLFFFVGGICRQPRECSILKVLIVLSILLTYADHIWLWLILDDTRPAVLADSNNGHMTTGNAHFQLPILPAGRPLLPSAI